MVIVSSFIIYYYFWCRGVMYCLIEDINLDRLVKNNVQLFYVSSLIWGVLKGFSLESYIWNHM